jgi:hypothetical protein
MLTGGLPFQGATAFEVSSARFLSHKGTSHQLHPQV